MSMQDIENIRLGSGVELYLLVTFKLSSISASVFFLFQDFKFYRPQEGSQLIVEYSMQLLQVKIYIYIYIYHLLIVSYVLASSHDLLTR